MHGQRRLSGKVDMLNGNLATSLIIFALPIAASSILQQLFNSVDVAVVGHFAADKAQATAAVGCNSSVINLIVNLFVGISVGANVIVSGYIGQGSKEKANRAVHTAMTIALLSGIVLLFIGLAISKPLLELMNTPEDVLPYAVQYLRIYSLGLPVIMIYNFGSAILRCTGVAIATVISNAISAALVLSFLLKEEGEAHLDIRKLGINRDDVRRILMIGVPAGVQSMVFSISNVIIQSVLNGFGTNAVAGSAVALNYENLAYFVISAFSQTVVTFTSQNFGAGKYRRCTRIFRLSFLYSVTADIVISWTFLLGKEPFAAIFTDNPEVASYAYMRMMIALAPHFLINTYEIGGAALRGMGHSMTPAVLTVLGTCLLRLIWAFSICSIWPRFEVLMLVYPLTWIITGSSVLIAYFTMRRKAFRMHHAVSAMK